MAVKLRRLEISSQSTLQHCKICYDTACYFGWEKLPGTRINMATHGVYLEYNVPEWFKNVFPFCDDSLHCVLCESCYQKWISMKEESVLNRIKRNIKDYMAKCGLDWRGAAR